MQQRIQSVDSQQIQPHKRKVKSSKNELFDLKYYKEKNWVDGQDEQGNWYLGMIKKRKENFVTVHFDGWSEKFKRVYCIHSPKLKSLRTKTIGYTGQKKIPLREFDFDNQIIHTASIKLKLLIQQQFCTFAPYDLSSFVRCDLFILVDSILTYPVAIDPIYIDSIRQLLRNTMSLIKTWIKISPLEFQHISQSDLTSDAYHFFNSSLSKYYCGYELILMLNQILGYDSRSHNFFGTYPNIYHEMTEFFIKEQMLVNLGNLLNFKNDEKKTHRVQFEMMWPVIHIIPKIFKNISPEQNSHSLKCYLLGLYSYLKAQLKENKIPENIKDDETFRDFINETLILHKIIFKNKNFAFQYILDRESEQGSKSISRNDSQQSFMLVHDDQDANESSIYPTLEKGPQPSISKIDYNQIQKQIGSPKNNDHQIIQEQKSESNIQQFGDILQQIESVKSQLEQQKTENKNMNYMVKQIYEQFKQQQSNQKNEIKQFSEQKDVQKVIKIISNLDNLMEFKSKKELVGDSQSQYAEQYIIDQDEFKTLTSLEFLLEKSKVVDSIKLIRWRKNILYLQNYLGYNIAQVLAKNTVSSLEIGVEDVLMANIQFFAQKENRNNLEVDFFQK